MDRYFILDVLSRYKGYYLDEYLYFVLVRPDSDHRSINLKDENVLRKLIAPEVYKKLKEQRLQTGTDWLKDKNFHQLQAYEQQLIKNKKYVTEKLRGFACTQIDHKRYKPAYQLLKAAIRVYPLYLKNYQTLLYYFRSLLFRQKEANLQS